MIFFRAKLDAPFQSNNTKINNVFLWCMFVFKMAGGPGDDTRAMRPAGPRLTHLSYFGFEKK